MNNRTILTVKSSWSDVIANSEDVGLLFYRKLFELDPALRPMFSDDIASQARKLMNMLTLLMSRVQQLEDLNAEIASLSRRHTQYGTKPEHYHTVRQALLWTLEQELQDRWDAEIREAWTEVYNLVANAMLRATSTSMTL